MSDVLKKTVAALEEARLNAPYFKEARLLPDKDDIISVLDKLQRILFPGYFGKSDEYFIGWTLADVRESLLKQISSVSALKGSDINAEDAVDKFISALPEVQKLLFLDIEAFFEGDPAAESTKEVIFSYPGFYAIFVYRLAHLLYELRVPFIPRIMTEHAHSLTGVDINAGAKIGKSFFIDHATGVVIGETTEIGDRVKIYQGVTIGALSTRGGQCLRGKKRHPTIGNDVTIYSGATLLGGETYIADGVTIPGNAFITRSVAKGDVIKVN
ncbi:MAG: serine acetyltransferase [Clostridia bacterium]|nr:serine acetyltransferase [Clostridia bacterium]